MDEIGLEAGLDLDVGLLVVGEDGDLRRLAVLGDVGLVQLRNLVAAPVEDEEIRRRPRRPSNQRHADRGQAQRAEHSKSLAASLPELPQSNKQVPLFCHLLPPIF